MLISSFLQFLTPIIPSLWSTNQMSKCFGVSQSVSRYVTVEYSRLDSQPKVRDALVVPSTVLLNVHLFRQVILHCSIQDWL